ncbi:hypothetical protein LINPERHAP2_LOCUS21072 [Linum perenne]
MKMNDGSAASSSRRADIEDEMLRKWAEEDRVMRGCSSDEDENEDGDDFEDDFVPKNLVRVMYECCLPYVRPSCFTGESFHPQNVEGWKKLWFHDFKHPCNAYFDYATREGFKKGSKLKPKVQIGEAVMDPEPLVQQQRVHAEKRIDVLHTLYTCLTFITMVDSRRRAEQGAEYAARNSVPANNFAYSPVVSRAATEYTPTLFAMFQE